MHDNIRRFALDGEIGDDTDFARLRVEFSKTIVDNMRDVGYVPVLEMGPYFSTEFVPSEKKKNRGTYKFLVTAYGVSVGRKRSWGIQGIDMETGTLYPNSTQAPK